MTITIPFDLTTDDIVAFYEHHAFTRERRAIHRRAVLTGIVVAALTAVFNYGLDGHVVASPLVGIVGLLLLLDGVRRRRAR